MSFYYILCILAVKQKKLGWERLPGLSDGKLDIAPNQPVSVSTR